MALQEIPKVENSAFYVNLAFKNANERAKISRQHISKKRTVIEKSKAVELEKMRTVREFLSRQLERIGRSFPSLNQLSRFYLELLKCHVDVNELKKSLGALNWASGKISDFFAFYKSKIRVTRNFEKINSYRRMFYGRVSSAMKQVDKNLKFIEESRRIMRNFPVIKEMPTVAIAGFPNVGKSTLLSRLSDARPEIAAYAFTTKKLNTGYLMQNGKRAIQLIDTPGTLNRMEKMNDIEKQAFLAMKYAADLIVYVFDPTETYPVKEQEKLLKKIKTELGKKTVIYISKTDLAETGKKGFRDFKELREKLLKELK